MPNWTTNYLSIYGDQAEIEKCVEAFTTVHEPEVRKAHNGDIIYTPNISLAEQNELRKKGKPIYGWWNPKTKEFLYPQTGKIRFSVPRGWKRDYTEREVQFPDFNKIVPQPDNLFRGNLGQKEREMCAKEGIPNWWDWNIANWGTKWNSSSCYSEGGEFTFSTAWCGVPDLIRKMSEKFPSLTFEYRCDHEDGGGEYFSFQGGEHV